MVTCDPQLRFKNKHVQSILASSKIRLLSIKKNNPVTSQSEKIDLKTKQAHLQGYYTKNKKADHLVILLHGWEGSADSTYIQLLANSLYKQADSSIFRLNLRDHGDTHHLNRKLFHSCLIQEVIDALLIVQNKYNYNKIYLAGFSLGGNFSLRLASKAYTDQLNFEQVFSISPPINPKNSMIAIEDSLLYKSYFLKKWRRSLTKKQQLYPQDFPNQRYKNTKSLDKLTEMLIIQHTEYETTDEYFRGYQITENIIDKIVPQTHVITSVDDPVIPFEDFKILQGKNNINLVVTPHGGHCGFIKNWSMRSWIEDYILEEIKNE